MEAISSKRRHYFVVLYSDMMDTTWSKYNSSPFSATSIVISNAHANPFPVQCHDADDYILHSPLHLGQTNQTNLCLVWLKHRLSRRLPQFIDAEMACYCIYCQTRLRQVSIWCHLRFHWFINTQYLHARPPVIKHMLFNRDEGIYH